MRRGLDHRSSERRPSAGLFMREKHELLPHELSHLYARGRYRLRGFALGNAEADAGQAHIGVQARQRVAPEDSAAHAYTRPKALAAGLTSGRGRVGR